MTSELVIVGAGGLGREVLDIIVAMNSAAPRPRFTVLGFLDRGPSATNLERVAAVQQRWIGTEEEWIQSGSRALVVIAIGDPVARRRLNDLFTSGGAAFATAVHPSAVLGSAARIAPGAIVCGGAQVSTNVQLGRHSHIGAHATIGHDAVIGDFVSVNPGAVISGEVQVGSGAVIGAGAVVLEQRRLGSGSIVGAAACVTRDVPPDTTVKGVPAK